jgi:hypothetical protein
MLPQRTSFQELNAMFEMFVFTCMCCHLPIVPLSHERGLELVGVGVVVQGHVASALCKVSKQTTSSVQFSIISWLKLKQKQQTETDTTPPSKFYQLLTLKTLLANNK